MLQRPDPQSYTKFLASVGLFLCILALVGQGLVLRETEVLQIKEADLAAYTPLARDELKRRQAVARDVAIAAPLVGGPLFVLGVVALIYSVPRLQRQEGAENERLQAELEKLKREIAPQDESERRARIEAEVDETSREITDATTSDRDDGATQEEVGKRESEDGGAAPPRAEHAHARAELMRRIAETEERVLRQIARIARPLYELRPQVKVGRPSKVFLDGLLVSSIDQLPDVVVEIKFLPSVSNLDRRVRDALRRLDDYRTSADLRSARLWLVVVTETELNPVQLERMADLAAQSGADVIVSVVQESRIEELDLPRDRLV